MAAAVKIEEAARAMILASVGITNSVPSARISHGYRLQDGILPAITYEITNASRQSLAGGAELWLASVEVTVIASTTKSALDMVPLMKLAFVPGTYLNVVFDAVIWNGHTTSAAVAGEGDEQEPAEVTASIDIYYRD